MSKVEYNQSGYIGNSMSVRAKEAYDNGEMPKSKWTKAAMLYAIEEWCDDNERIYDPNIEKMTKKELFNKFFHYSSWHHTGKYANPTDFYSLDENVLSEVTQLAKERHTDWLTALQEIKEAKEKEIEKRQEKILKDFEKRKVEEKKQKEIDRKFQKENGYSSDSPIALKQIRPDLVKETIVSVYVKTPDGIKRFRSSTAHKEKLYGFNCIEFPNNLPDYWKDFLKEQEPSRDFYFNHGYAPDSAMALQNIRPDLVIEKEDELKFMTPYGISSCDKDVADWWPLVVDNFFAGFNVLNMGRSWNNFLDKTESKVFGYNRLFWSGLTPKDEIEQIKIEKACLNELAENYDWISNWSGIIRVHKKMPNSLRMNVGKVEDERYIPLGCFESALFEKCFYIGHTNCLKIERLLKEYDKELRQETEQNRQSELEQDKGRER